MQRSVREIEFGFELANTHVEPEERVDGEEPLGERDLRPREDRASLVVEGAVTILTQVPLKRFVAAVPGLEALVTGLQEQLDVEVGVLATVPIGFKDTRDQRTILDGIQYATPEIIGERASLMEGCWMKQCSAFRYVREFRDRRRDYELETLAQFDRLARHLENEVGIDAPNPPEPGDLEHEVVVA